MASSPTMLAEAMIHTLDPYVWQITPGFGVRWYGIAYILGFIVGWFVLHQLAKSRRIPLSTRQVGDLVSSIIVGVVVGGRLGHVIFYEPHILLEFSGSFPFWEVLAIHRGGMSSHGGVIGVALTIVMFARREKLPILAVGDAVAFAVPWGLMFGRLANWVNGELWGRRLADEMQATAPWWSVKYPHELRLYDTLPPALEPLRGLAPAALRMHDAKCIDWIIATAYDHSSPAHSQVMQAIGPVLTAYYPSQIFQALAEGPALLLLMALVWLAPRKAGVVAGAFFTGYGALRFLTEQYRQPDQGVAMIGGLTLPMLLSIAMIAIGAMFLALSRRSQPIGGLVWSASREPG